MAVATVVMYDGDWPIGWIFMLQTSSKVSLYEGKYRVTISMDTERILVSFSVSELRQIPALYRRMA